MDKTLNLLEKEDPTMKDILDQFDPEFKKECIELSLKIGDCINGKSKLTCFYAIKLIVYT